MRRSLFIKTAAARTLLSVSDIYMHRHIHKLQRILHLMRYLVYMPSIYPRWVQSTLCLGDTLYIWAQTCRTLKDVNGQPLFRSVPTETQTLRLSSHKQTPIICNSTTRLRWVFPCCTRYALNVCRLIIDPRPRPPAAHSRVRITATTSSSSSPDSKNTLTIVVGETLVAYYACSILVDPAESHRCREVSVQTSAIAIITRTPMLVQRHQKK